MSKEKKYEKTNKSGSVRKNGERQDKSNGVNKPPKTEASTPKISKEKAEQNQHDKPVH